MSDPTTSPKPMQQGLLFMPDISGFTAFVQQTEVKHSKHIVKELLELLIDQNTIGLKLAEIEGDALFFYKENAEITPTELVNQIKGMYQAFHQHLLVYKYKRVCNCGACTNAEGLKLKFVIHEAEIEFIQVKDSKKPFGQEVIKLHRLLKNKIPEQEYALFSSEYLDHNNDEISNLFGTPPIVIEDEFDFGAYQYGYNSLSQIEKPTTLDSSNSAPHVGRLILSKSIQLPVHPNDLFQFILDFDNRSLWSGGVDRIEYDADKINQVGGDHICVIGGSPLKLSTVFADRDGEDLIFIESTEDAPIVKNLNTVYRVSATADGAQLQVDFHTKSTSLLGRLLTPLLRAKLGGNLSKSLNSLRQALLVS